MTDFSGTVRLLIVDFQLRVLCGVDGLVRATWVCTDATLFRQAAY